MIRIIADDKIPFLKGVLEPYANVTYLPGKHITKDAAMVADALLIRTRTRCNEQLLEGTPVKFIATATIGYDHIDTGFCKRAGISWTNAPGCNSYSVKQYVSSALLRIAGESGFSLKGKTIGIVGVGNVGRKIEEVATILGMNVLVNDPPRARREKDKRFVDLEQLLSGSDIITLHVPLNMEGQDKTFHFFNDETFSKIKKGTWFINCSRGEVVDTAALKKALEMDFLAGSVLDVWEREPELDIPLMHMSFIATPHIAGYSADGKANGTAMSVRSLCKHFNLPLGDWFPKDVPSPSEPLFSIECEGKSDEEILRKVVFHTYNIVEDDIKLRFDPSKFEKLRGDYPVRREFPAYTIDLVGGSPEIKSQITGLGFKVVI